MTFIASIRLKSPFSDSAAVENSIFKLCYSWTVSILVLFSSIITCRLLLGNSFTCLSHASAYPRDYINEKCYADGTYNRLSNLIAQKDSSSSIQISSENELRYHTYYPWVNLLFLAHAFNFFLPHLLWNSYESGYMNRLTSDTSKDSLNELARYFLTGRNSHTTYVSLYVFFEICNFAISTAQIYWLIYFFDINDVPDSPDFTLETWSDYRHFYFPPTGMCDLKEFSKSGVSISNTATCQMPLNRMYMIMFLFLHAWYFFIAVLTALNFFCRMCYITIPRFRYLVLKSSARHVDPPVMRALCSNMSYPDLFVLFRMQKTMSDIDFNYIVDGIVRETQPMRLKQLGQTLLEGLSAV